MQTIVGKYMDLSLVTSFLVSLHCKDTKKKLELSMSQNHREDGHHVDHGGGVHRLMVGWVEINLLYL